MKTLEEIKSELAELNIFISNADAKVRTGEMVALFQLDEQVAKLCEESVQLAPNEIAEVQPLLANLIKNLEQLSISIKEYQDKLNQEGKL